MPGFSCWCGRRDLNPHAPFGAEDFKSPASTIPPRPHGRNPRTGEAVEVDAKRVPYFKPGKEMRERLNLNGGAGDL